MFLKEKCHILDTPVILIRLMNLLRQRQRRRGKVSLNKVEIDTEINIYRKLETKIEIKIHRKLDQKFKDRIFVATTVGEKIRSVAKLKLETSK